MKKILSIQNGILPGDDMRTIIGILPDIKDKFRQRKEFDEYYNDLYNYERTFTLDEIDKLTQEFSIEIGYSTLIIK